MKKKTYICAGLIVRDTNTDKIGKVIVTDPVSKFAVVRDEHSYWTQWFRNLEVASYKEVE